MLIRERLLSVFEPVGTNIYAEDQRSLVRDREMRIFEALMGVKWGGKALLDSSRGNDVNDAHIVAQLLTFLDYPPPVAEQRTSGCIELWTRYEDLLS